MKGIELVRIGGKWAQVLGYQNIRLYEVIDFEKPGRSMQMGMMPAKLTHTLLNIGLSYLKEDIEKNISEENKKNVQKLKNEIKEFKNNGNKENITQKELSNNIQKVIEKSSEKWSNTEKEKGEKALDIVRNHLGNNEYSYNLMDKINDNTYMVVVLDSNTREVIRILLFGFRKKYSSKGRIEIG